MNKYAIIVAGGNGLRMGADLPKQFLEIGGKPILMHSIEKFEDFNIIVVLPENQIDFWKELCKKHNFTIEHKIVSGGSERFYSVKNGLKIIDDNEAVVAIHDGVRPFVSKELVKKLTIEAINLGNAIPFTKSKESIREIKETSSVAVDRSKFVFIQTPQIFLLSQLKKGYEQTFESKFTDDASVVENVLFNIHLIEGEYTNIKITTPEDLPKEKN